jgi:hypothetical protein
MSQKIERASLFSNDQNLTQIRVLVQSERIGLQEPYFALFTSIVSKTISLHVRFTFQLTPGKLRGSVGHHPVRQISHH